MAECPSPTTISQLLPVVGTLLGATIGFVGGLLNSWLTQRGKESTEREGRERNRLESLYETLLEVRMSYQGMLGDMINKVHSGTQAVVKAPSGIPPLIRLDMVIHMYFPSLNEAYKQFVAVKDRFGDAWGKNFMAASFANEPLDMKQKICSEYWALFKELDNEISNLQQKLAAMAKA